MTRRGRSWTLAAASACWLCSAGCAGVTMTAANSINPVMFGPVKALRAGNAPGELSRVTGSTSFHHRETEFAVAAFAGYGGGGFASSSTNPAGVDESGPEWSAILAGRGVEIPARLDWKVFRATGEDPGRRVELTSIRCGGFNSFFLFGVLLQNGCEMEGVVPAAQ